MSAVAYSAHGSGLEQSAGHRAPQRIQWSLLALATGCVAMFSALILSIAGVPGNLTYDAGGPGERVKNHSNDPMKINKAIDLNIKYVAANSGYEHDQMNGLFSAISKSEDQIPILARAVVDMNGDVVAIDDGIKEVRDTTIAMRTDMQAMAATSESSAATMSSLNSDISSLGGSMSALANATNQLTVAYAAIERKAGAIASHRTNKALSITKGMNRVLPARVPAPETSLLPGTAPYPRGAQ